MPYVPTGGKAGRPRKYPVGMPETEIRRLQREAKAAAGVAAPVAAAPPRPAPTPTPAPPAPAGPAHATNPQAAAAKAAAAMGLPAAGPAPGAPPPPPVMSASEKENYCVDRIQMIKAAAAWGIAKKFGIDTDRTPVPRKLVDLSDGFAGEIKLNAEFLYPYLSAVSGPWALAAAAVFETIGLVSSLRAIAPPPPAPKRAADPAAPPPAARAPKMEPAATEGWATARSEAPEAEMK